MLQPKRTSQKISQKLFATLFTISLSAFYSFYTSAFASQIHTELLKAADNKSSGEYVRGKFQGLMKKSFSTKDKKKALIIGDSHAQDFLNSMLENGYLKDYQIRTRHVPTHCQLYMDDDASRFIEEKYQVLCEESDSLAKATKQIADADLIILAANWKLWSARELPKTIEKLNLKPEQKLLVIGRKSFGKVSIRNYLRMPEEKLRTLRNKVDAKQVKINEIMSKTLSDSVFVNQHKLVCETTTTCPVFTDDLKLISFDGGHLTKDGARYIGKILFEESQLGSL